MPKRRERAGPVARRRQIGMDAKGRAVHLGDLVKHTQHSFGDGIVLSERDSESGRLLRLFGEPGAIVAYPDGHTRSNRLSRMIVIGKANVQCATARARKWSILRLVV